MCAIYESPNHIYTDLTLLTLKALITKSRKILFSAETFEASLTNNVDPDQTIGAV